MEINITRFIKGAKEAKGLVVIIDVFRAFSVAYYVLAGGANRIIPFLNIDNALKMKKENSQYLLLGEHDCKKVDGFDYGNSPFEIKNIDMKDKTILLRSTRGTAGLMYLNEEIVDEVILGSFVAFFSIIKYIQLKQPKIVTIIAMGEGENKEAYEDELCAQCIKDALKGKKVDFKQIYILIKNSPASERFFDKTKVHSPEEDFYMCLNFNKFDFVVKYDIKSKILVKN